MHITIKILNHHILDTYYKIFLKINNVNYLYEVSLQLKLHFKMSRNYLIISFYLHIVPIDNTLIIKYIN